MCERCHTSSLHSRYRTSPTLLGAIARSCRAQCTDSTGQIVRLATKSGLGMTVPKLVLGMCRYFGAGCLLTHGGWAESVHLPPGTCITTTCQLFGEDRKLTIPSVILFGTCRVPGRVSRPTKVLQ